MEDEARFWKRFEGQSASNELDAEHWIRVYTELQATLERVSAAGGGDSTRVRALLRVFDERLGFWRTVQHDAPVHAVRSERRHPTGGGRTRSA